MFCSSCTVKVWDIELIESYFVHIALNNYLDNKYIFTEMYLMVPFCTSNMQTRSVLAIHSRGVGFGIGSIGASINLLQNGQDLLIASH